MGPRVGILGKFINVTKVYDVQVCGYSYDQDSARLTCKQLFYIFASVIVYIIIVFFQPLSVTFSFFRIVFIMRYSYNHEKKKIEN